MNNATAARGDCPSRRNADSVGSGLRLSGASDVTRLLVEGLRGSGVVGFCLGSTEAGVCSDDDCTGARLDVEGPTRPDGR